MDDYEKYLPSTTQLVLMLLVVPVCVALFFGMFAFKGMTPSVFRCSKCGREFTRKAWRGWPRRCSTCGAPDWNSD
jgi:hypothetical protein